MTHSLNRAWRAVVGEEDAAPVFVDETAPDAIIKVMHQSIIKVTSDIENMSFNTAISQLMIFNNELMKMDKRYREPCETFAKLLHPFAPHIAEEMWSLMGHGESLTNVAWPKGDESKTVESTVEVVFQVNGKLRAKVNVDKNLDKAALEKIALENSRVQEFTAGKTVVKVIAVPGKLVNVVVK